MIKTKDKENNLLPVQKCISGAEIKSLSDSELLAIIIGTGFKDFNVIELSSYLLNKFGNLYNMYYSGLRELSSQKGIGLKKAIKIHAAFELGKRILSNPPIRNKISNPQKVWEILLPEMAGLQKEEFRLLILNNKNFLIRKTVVSIGTVSETIVHPREVFIDAIREGGAGIIIAHNHPSGELEPSRDDIETTKRILETGKLVGIPLLDHVIISNSNYLSLKEAGFL